jgi:hypothetical protein
MRLWEIISEEEEAAAFMRGVKKLDEIAAGMRERDLAQGNISAMLYMGGVNARNDWETDFIRSLNERDKPMTWRQFDTLKKIVERGN